MKKKVSVISVILIVVLFAGLFGGKWFFRQKSGEKPVKSPEVQKGILVQEFTCASLRKYLTQKVDGNRDGILTEKELGKVTKLELTYADSKSLNLQEFDHFPKLRELTVTIEKQTGDLFVEKLPYVTKLTLYCVGKKKKGRSVVIRNIPQLKFLDMGIYSAPRIKIEKCASLDDILCETNASAVSFKALGKIRSIMLTAEKLKDIRFTNIDRLKSLDVSYAYPIKEIDLSGLEQLDRFTWSEGSLEKVVWGKKDKLSFVKIYDNNFQGVLDLDKDIPKNVSTIDCGKNQITEIRGKHKKYIYSLDCQKNKLRRIDLPNTELLCIDGSGNKNVQVYLRSKQDWLEASPGAHFFDKSAKVHYKNKWGG